MNNMLRSLLVSALALSASHVSAHTNQIYMSSPRAQAASILHDSHVTRNLVQARSQDRFGGNFLVSGFYSQSNKASDLGKFLGVNDKSSFKAYWGTVANTDGDLNAGYLVHDYDVNAGRKAAPATSYATINLAPQTTSYGVEFAYRQCLGKILDGLHLAVTLPVERVENNMNLSVTNAAGNANTSAASVTKALNEFFAGKVGTGALGLGPIGAQADQGGQHKLTKALFAGKQSATGIADIKVLVGYDFVRGGDWRAGLNVGFTIPTGNSLSAQYAFEPLYGNAGHWELGFGGAVDGFLWRDGDQSIELHLSADYRYGFKANETRVLGGEQNWSQYYLAGAAGAARHTIAPLANTPATVSVTPNSSLRGNIGLEYDNGGFLFGVNYAPAWRQAESGNWGGSVAAGTIVLAPEGDPAGAVLAAVAGRELTTADVKVSRSLRPSQLSHRLGANMGYTFKEMEFPIALGVGGHYDLAQDNATAQNWGVNITAGIGF